MNRNPAPSPAAEREDMEDQWARVLVLTESMRENAIAADWETVAALESVREPLLREVMDQPVTSSAASVIVENIQSILRTDAEIRRLGQVRLDELQAHLLQIERKQKATLAYSRPRL